LTSASASPSNVAGRAAPRPAQDEKLPQLDESRFQPIALTAGKLREGGSEQRQLVGLDLHDDFARGIARGREQRSGRKAERLSQTRKDRGARLLDPASLEL
jgi:hypothetical protein